MTYLIIFTLCGEITLYAAIQDSVVTLVQYHEILDNSKLMLDIIENSNRPNEHIEYAGLTPCQRV